MRIFHALDDLFCVLFDNSPVANVGGTMSSIPWWRQRRECVRKKHPKCPVVGMMYLN